MALTEKFSGSVSMLAWAYNEEELIEDFLVRSFALLDTLSDDVELVLVDDGSTDRTPSIAAAFAVHEPRLRIVTHPTNMQVGHAVRTAFRSPAKEYFFFQTVDWSYDLKNARTFLELLRHYDIVKGMRPVPERILSHIPLLRSIYRVKCRSDTVYKAVVSLANYYILRILYGLPFHDFQNIFFARSALIKDLTLRSQSAFANPEALIRAFCGKARIIEVPIHFLKRTKGEAKGTKPMTVVRSVIDVFRTWLEWGHELRRMVVASRPFRIHRVNEPAYLDDDVLELCLPLFKQFRG